MTMTPSHRSCVALQPFASWDTAAFTRFLQAAGEFQRLSAARQILIKPNLCAGNLFLSDSGVVISRDALDRLLSHIRAINPTAVILVGESDSAGFGWAYLKAEHQNYRELLARHDATFVDLSRTRVMLYKVKAPNRFKSGIWLSEVFEQADFFISFGKLKTHNMTTVSISMKNLFGCLPEARKEVHHPWIHETVADITQAIRPDLQVIDALPALEGNGPVHGTPIDLGYVLLGTDPVATDSVAARILGFAPERIRHIVLAERSGVGKMTPDELIAPPGVTPDRLMSRAARRPPWQNGILNPAGLQIQRVGQFIAEVGHVIHVQSSFLAFPRALGKRLLRTIRGRR